MSTAALKAAAKGEIAPEQGRNPYEVLKRQLENSKGEFVKLVGSPANADKFIRVVLNAVLANPDLLDASRSSLVAACMKCAQDSLLPDGREAVLNIYSTKVKAKEGNKVVERWEKRAQYLPMVGGLVKKLYASGEVTYIDAACVYKGDVFKFQRGDEPKLIHEPALEYADADLIDGSPIVIAVYAVAKLKNGEIKREVMTRRDIEKVRAASKSADTGPWKTWFEEMAIKSVIKRINKQLPHSDAFEELAQYDNTAMGYTGLGESAAAIAERALQDQPQNGAQALEHQPGEVLEPSVIEQAEAVRRADANRSQQEDPEQKHAEGIGREEQAGVTPQSEREAATAVEVKLRAAKDMDALDLAAEGGRVIRDNALRLRLDELYEARARELQP